jgi:enolase-phosphatase E1
VYSGLRYVLLDIEGTISDIKFVKNVLFPYSAKEMRNFISQNKNNPRVRACLRDVGARNDEEAVVQLLDWIKADNKHPALKTLQGMIWKKGYTDGEFRSHLYDDVLPTWESWRQGGLRLGIYSSGSEEAQKLFFTYTASGDVLSQLDAHFDLTVGPKREKQSYSRIADVLKLPADEILFLSDVVEELDAAAAAGFKTALIVRGESENLERANHQDYSSLDQIDIAMSQ